MGPFGSWQRVEFFCECDGKPSGIFRGKWHDLVSARMMFVSECLQTRLVTDCLGRNS